MHDSTKRLHIVNARTLLRSEHSGVLATQSLSVKNFPFGSVTPFVMTDNGNLIIYASDIAQHSRNMKADKHVSLCAYNGKQSDSQASARVTLLATASWDDVDEQLQQRYFALFPKAKAYVEAHDFRFYTLSINRVRYIGGFGEIYWFSESEWRAQFADMQALESGIVQHMMDDHLDAIQLMLLQQFDISVPPQAIKMLTVFAEGFHVAADQLVYFVKFDAPIEQPEDVRQAMVVLTQRARVMVQDRLKSA